MIVKGLLKKGEYFDSVSLMIVSKDINNFEGIIDSSVVMGTNENKAILKAAELFLPEFENTSDTDLIIAIKAENEKYADSAYEKIDDLLNGIRKKADDTSDFVPKSFQGGLEKMPEANLSLISIAGKYATDEAWKALKNGLHVMLFSDNVSLEDEIALKKYGAENGLLVMGPDCGTAIINGIPLAFANVVNKGNIGLVGASGTGLQEVTSIISNEGAGISHAIGTGGRDVKKDVGGIMFIEAMKALNEDEETKIIVLVSKPPHNDVLKKIASEIEKIDKPIVGIFIGGDPDVLENAGAIPANTLEEAAIIAATLSKGVNIDKARIALDKKELEIELVANEYKNKVAGKFIRGLFSGGTLCDEAQLLLQKHIGYTYSNTPLNSEYYLDNLWKSYEHTIIDMGEDEFTSGRPHPMIDFSLRNKRIIQESEDKEVAVILLDIVLGYGSNLNPADELAPNIKQALKNNKNLAIVCSITGTDKDPQNRKKTKQILEAAGAIVMSSNVAACELAGKIVL